MTQATAPTIALISNPNSGHNREQFAEVEALLARQPAIQHIVTRSPADIAPALQALAEQRVDLLAINGGDGSAAAILGQVLELDLFETVPVIALLPGGTANLNAGDVGVRGKLMPALRRFCDWSGLRQPPSELIVERPLLRLQTGGATHYGMFLGAGAVIKGTEYAHQSIHAHRLRDELSLTLATARTIWGLIRSDPRFKQSVSIELRLDDSGEPTGHDALIFVASTLHSLFLGMRPFWGSGQGKLRVTLIEQDCTRFLRTLVSIVRGRPNRNAVAESGYFSHNVDSLSLTMDGRLNLDGEIIQAQGEVRVETTANLRFLRL